MTEKQQTERDRELAEFYRQNPKARYYCQNKGTPPRPEQYNLVTTWTLWPEGLNEREIDQAARHHGGLVLIGASFTGKTTAVYHLFQKEVQKASTCLAVSSERLNRLWELPYGEKSDFLEDMREVDYLLLDDLDKVNITPSLASELWALFENRFRGAEFPSPTFITMNTRTRTGFIKLFCGRDSNDSRKIGESIYNRISQVLQVVDFDAATKTAPAGAKQQTIEAIK